MESWAVEEVGKAVERILVERFEHRPYNRAALSMSPRAGEPRVSVVMKAAETSISGCSLASYWVVVTLAAASEHEHRMLQVMLETISLLHDADIDTSGLVVTECAFSGVNMERLSAVEESRCHAAFRLAVLRD